MHRRRVAVVLGAGAVVAAAWFGSDLLGGSTTQSAAAAEIEVAPRSEALARARLTGELHVLDEFVAQQRAACGERDDDPECWRVLAEAHLERCLLRDRHRGMTVGEPTHEELPAANREDIDAGLAAADRALALGDTTADVHRIKAGLLSLRVTGFASALATRPAISAALARAEEIERGHPRVLVARGCEKLFAPNRLLGHDPRAARELLLAAADALPLDERPFVLAAMCEWLLARPDAAVTLLERATARNPNNVYAHAVLERLKANERDPFGRDV